jgi:virginiamycin B lyase
MRVPQFAACLSIIALASCGGGASNAPLTPNPGGSAAGSNPVIQVVQQNVPAPFEEVTIPTAGSKPAGIAAAADGTLWFAEAAANRVAQISNTGVITEPITLAPGSAPQGVMVDSSTGDVWFTEKGASKIGHWHSGALTQYATLTANSAPYGIAKGSDGNIWFTENAAGNIAKISTSGSGATEYSTGHKGSTGLTTIVAGPDGNLWFAESAAAAVGRITTKGAIATYGVKGAPQDLAVAGDGNIWFTQPSLNQVGYITTKGVSNVFAAANGSTPWGITKGPDANPWFTETGANALQSISTGSTPTFSASYGIPTSASNPFALATGNDGNLWFTEQNANKIGVYLYHHQTATPSSIGFTSTGQTQTFSVSETNYSGTFWAKSSNAAIASVSPASGATMFTVKAIAPGTAAVTVSDNASYPQSGNGTTISVTVTTTTITIQ